MYPNFSRSQNLLRAQHTSHTIKFHEDMVLGKYEVRGSQSLWRLRRLHATPVRKCLSDSPSVSFADSSPYTGEPRERLRRLTPIHQHPRQKSGIPSMLQPQNLHHTINEENRLSAVFDNNLCEAQTSRFAKQSPSRKLCLRFSRSEGTT